MKILQVNKYHYPRGGADRYYLDLGERLELSGHDVAYFAMKHPNNKPSIWEKYFVSRVSYNESVWRYALKIPGRTIYSLAAKKKFKQLVKDFRPDIIHIHNIYHQISPSILDVAYKAGIPVVMHLHDYKLVCPNHALFVHNKVCQKCLGKNYCPCIKNRCVKDSFGASLLAALEMYLHHRVLKIYKKKINIFLSPSFFLKNLLVSAGWPEDKIKVINNPFRSDLEPTGDINREDYFLFYGRLSSEKGIDIAIKAVRANTELKLKIAGSGPEEANLKNLTKERAVTERVEFLGWQEGKSLAKLISRAQAVLVPSRWLENFPLSALESLSLGTPVIAANLGGLPEIINSGNGYLVEPEDPKALQEAMLNIIHGKTFRDEEIRSSSQKYLPEKNLEAVLLAYKSVIKK